MKSISQPILKVTNLCYRTKSGAVLLDKVSFEVFPAESMVIVGPNGAGKSILLKLLAGVNQASSGEIYYSSSNLKQLSLQQRATKIAVISQHEQPDYRLKVSDYIRLGTIPREQSLSVNDINSVVAQAMSVLGITHLRDKCLDKLSGGERQRVYIARSVCQKPDVLLLDEPTNHLDPKAKGEVLSAITALGITTVTVLHELPLAAQIGDKILVIENSRMKAFGQPAKILTAQTVNQVFGVGLHRFPHPEENRELVCLDIPLIKNNKHMEFA